MNLKNLLIACAVLMAGFTSCSNDSDTDNSGVVANGKPTVAKITLTQKGSSTRAASTTKEPTDAEKVINKATLYIFNAAKTFVKQVDFDVVASPNSASKTVELTTGTHYFYALVNYPGTAPSFTGTPTLAAVIADVNNQMSLTALRQITGATNGFLMSSIGEPVSQILVEANQVQAENELYNTITLPVGRAMAKVNASFEIANAATDQPATGTLGSVQYQGANNPSTMYALPNYVVNQLQTPYFTTYSTNTVDQTQYFPTLPNDFSMSPSTDWVDADGVEANAIYMVENSNQTPKEGNSSFVLLKGVFSPNAAYCYSGTDGTKLSAAIVPGTVDAEVSFWCASTADGKVYKKRFFDSDPDGTILTQLTNEVKDGNTYTQAIKYYNGEAYYPFFLQDDTKSERIAKYTTARNNYYGVTITSVSDLGANTPSGVITPENPLGAEAWIKGKIEILDWNTVTQSGGI